MVVRRECRRRLFLCSAPLSCVAVLSLLPPASLLSQSPGCPRPACRKGGSRGEGTAQQSRAEADAAAPNSKRSPPSACALPIRVCTAALICCPVEPSIDLRWAEQIPLASPSPLFARVCSPVSFPSLPRASSLWPFCRACVPSFLQMRVTVLVGSEKLRVPIADPTCTMAWLQSEIIRRWERLHKGEYLHIHELRTADNVRLDNEDQCFGVMQDNEQIVVILGTGTEKEVGPGDMIQQVHTRTQQTTRTARGEQGNTGLE